MNKRIIKNIIILSLIFGFILGILSPIPYISGILLFAMAFLTAPIVMVYMIMDGKFDLTTTQDSIITGAIAGLCANFTYCFMYSIILFILAKIFNYTTNLILTSMLINSPIWLLLTFIIFIGVLFATTNAFAGFITYYLINLIRDIYEKNTNRK